MKIRELFKKSETPKVPADTAEQNQEFPLPEIPIKPGYNYYPQEEANYYCSLDHGGIADFMGAYVPVNSSDPIIFVHVNSAALTLIESLHKAGVARPEDYKRAESPKERYWFSNKNIDNYREFKTQTEAEKFSKLIRRTYEIPLSKPDNATLRVISIEAFETLLDAADKDFKAMIVDPFNELVKSYFGDAEKRLAETSLLRNKAQWVALECLSEYYLSHPEALKD